tara:strand:- start:61 stop:255 length:195 start_codon:yes stop_codon:yes gene_type:complete
MIDLQQEKEQIIKHRLKLERQLNQSICTYCLDVLPCDEAFYAIQELEKHMLMTLDRISRQLISE